MSKSLKDFLLDLVLAIIPLILGGLTYMVLDINTLKADTKHIKELTESTIQMIDHRLERIENKLDESKR